MISGSWLEKQRTGSRILNQLGSQSPYYHNLVRWDGFEAEVGETPIEACLQLGWREVTLKGEAEACGCSLDGDLTGLGGWDGLRRGIGDHELVWGSGMAWAGSQWECAVRSSRNRPQV